jgi:hypothetical protein
MTTKIYDHLKVELSYDISPINSSQNTTWTDVTADVRSVSTRRGVSLETGSMLTGAAEVVLDNRDRTYDFIPSGLVGGYFDGTIGDSLNAADGLAAGLTGLDIRCVCAATSWDTTYKAQALVSQWQDGDPGAFTFGITDIFNGDGLWFECQDDDLPTYFSVTAGTAIPFENGELGIVRVTWRSSDGRIQFFTKATTGTTYKADADANTGWTQLGSDETGPTSALWDSAYNVNIGTSWDNSWAFAGRLLYVSIAETIDGTAVMSVDVADYSSGSTFSSGGDTWMITNATDTGGLRLYNDDDATAAKLRPRIPVRIYADNVNAVDYPIFTGYITRVRQNYDVNGDAVVVIECLDGFAFMATTLIEKSEMTVTASATTVSGVPPDFGFELDGPAEFYYSSQPNVYIPKPVLRAFGTPQAGEQIVPYGPESSVYFDGNLGLGLNEPIGYQDTSPASYSMWFRTSTPGETFQPRILFASPHTLNGDTAPYVGLDEDGYLVWTTSEAETGIVSRNLADGEVHHLVFINGNGFFKVWLDGVGYYYATGFASCHFLDHEYAWAIGAAWNWVPLSLGFIGEISHFWHWPVALSDAQAVALYHAGNTGSTGDLTSDRLSDLLDVIGWPTALRDIATGYGVCGGNSFNDDVLSALSTLAATEQGLIFIDKSGNLTMRNRYWQTVETTGSTSQATFSSDGAAGSIGYQTMAFQLDGETVLYNDVTVTGTDPGISARYRDESSVFMYGVAGRRISTVLQTSDMCQSMAYAIVDRYKDPQVRVAPFQVRLTDVTDIEDVLALELGDRITVELDPPGGGTQVVKELSVETIRHSITQQQVWDVTISGTPVDPNTYFVLDVSELDSGDVIGF